MNRWRAYPWAVGGALLALAAVRPAAAQLPQQPLPARLSLPAVPVLRLSLPTPGTLTEWLQRQGSAWPAAANAVVPREWLQVPDGELRLELETGRLDLGRFSVTGQLSTVPGRERDCQPDCRGAGWSSSLRLKYDTGRLGPLRETGPELNIGWTRVGAGVKPQGLVRGGFSGKF